MWLYKSLRGWNPEVVLKAVSDSERFGWAFHLDWHCNASNPVSDGLTTLQRPTQGLTSPAAFASITAKPRSDFASGREPPLSPSQEGSRSDRLSGAYPGLALSFGFQTGSGNRTPTRPLPVRPGPSSRHSDYANSLDGLDSFRTPVHLLLSPWLQPGHDG